MIVGIFCFLIEGAGNGNGGAVFHQEDGILQCADMCQIDNVTLVAAQKNFLFCYSFQDRGKLLA